ncbi:MAG: Exodeoxyribonuclease 7 small subunit [Verrucomicrobiae bacterium]|nr:Exodeoxyribonuclease 7 small subunit [Verrucomicrobiae bacterium]
MKPSKKTAAPNEPSFEQAVERLEKIVADMENAELPLDDILKQYEEGTRLVRFCAQKLDEAEKKIELLQKKSDGSVTLKPFEPAAADDDDKEAKLF